MLPPAQDSIEKRRQPSPVPLQGIIEFSGVILSIDRLVTMVVAAVVFLVLHLLATRTRIGKSVLATAQNPEAACIIGIPVDRVRLMAFAVGCGLAGLGGVL